MGEAYTAISEGPYSAWWNPAGLGSVEAPTLGATYTDSLEGVANQYVSMAYPLSYGSTYGVNITRLSVPPFQGYDAQGVKNGTVASSDMAVGAAYGRTLLKDEIERPVFNVGAGLKMISEALDGATARTAAVDLGALYYLRPDHYWMGTAPAQEFRLGLAVRNIGPGLKFDRESAPLPLSLSLGGSWHSHPGGSGSLIFSLDQTISKDEDYYAAFGAEYTAFQLLSFRAGYRTGQAIGSGLRIGVGFRFSFMDLDYAMSPYGELGAMHKVGISLRLGASGVQQPLAGKTSRAQRAKFIAPKEKIEKLDIFAKDFLALARKDLSERRFISAQDNIRKAFNLEPGLKNAEWGGRGRRLDAVIERLRLKDMSEREELLGKQGEQSDIAARALDAYIEGKDLKALLLAHAALGTNLRGDALYEELLYVVSDLVKIHVRRDEIMPYEALINEKLRKAAKGFYMRQFDMTAKECEEVVLLEDGSNIAWIRLGSAYFMMGDKEKAKGAYRKALALVPDDKVTLEFMRTQGW